MKYAQSDSNGNINAYYDSTINSVAQIGTAIKITDAQWLDCVNNLGKWLIVSGALQLAPAPTTAQLLTASQVTQINLLAAGYANAIVQPVSYTSVAGVVKTYQADKQSRDNLGDMTLAYLKAAVTPTGFYWLATDNTQVPFTFADLQQLAAVMGVPGWTAFQNLQTKKASVMAATTVSAVQLIVW